MHRVKTYENLIRARIEGRQDYITSSGPTPWTLFFGVDEMTHDSVEFDLEVAGWRNEIRHHRSATSKLIGVEHKFHGRAGNYVGATVRQAAYQTFPEVRFRTELAGNFKAISAPGEGGLSAALVDANNQALMRLNKNLLKVRQSLPGLVAIGELGETLRMIRHPAESLLKGIYEYLGVVKKRAGNKRLPLKKRNSIVADTWLEYSYGWAPLINDVKGAAEGLAKRSSYMAVVSAISGYGQSTNTTHYGNYPDIQNGHIYLKRHGIVNRQVAEVRYHGVISNDPADWVFGSANFGFTPSDFIPAIWELIPYSFLVDYFSNIGNVIQAYTTDTSGVRWLEKGTRTSSHNFVKEISYTLSPLPSSPPGIYSYLDVIYSGPVGESGYEIVRRTRDKYEQSIVPSLEFTIPGLSLKWLNMAALGITHRKAISDLR